MSQLLRIKTPPMDRRKPSTAIQKVESRWATAKGIRQARMAADWDKPLQTQRVRVREALQPRVQKLEFQYLVGETWKTLFAGEKLGPSFGQKFEPVTAQRFRLNNLEATGGPTIGEIELLEKTTL